MDLSRLFGKKNIRNPGCKFCLFYLSPYHSGRQGGVCIKHARKKKRVYFGRTVVRYIDCLVPKIKNSENRCEDFKIEHFFVKFLKFLKALPTQQNIMNLEKCAYVGEDWWNDQANETHYNNKTTSTSYTIDSRRNTSNYQKLSFSRIR